MDINNLYSKIENILAYLKPSSDNDNKNVIDLQKTFSSQNLDFNKDILPVIKKILHLPETFPNNILHSKDGHKYNELEFFQSNITSGDATIDTIDTTATATSVASFFQKINKTQTKLGQHLLQSILLTPLHTPSDVQNILKNRQQVIQNLITNPNLDGIITKIKELSNIEQDLLAILLPDTPEMQEVYKIIFFELKPLQGLNYNETFQKLFCYFLIIFSPLYGIVSPFLFMFVPFLFLRYVLKVPISLSAFSQILKNMILGGTGFFANLNKILNSGVGSVVEGIINQTGGGGIGGSGISIKGVVFWLAKMIIGFMNSPFGTYAYIGFIVISYLYGIYNSLQVSITYNKIINMFHSRLNIISKWLKECVVFYKSSLCFESNEIIRIRQQIDQLLGNPIIKNLLEHKTFTHEPGLISNKGMIIKTFREFLDTKKTLQIFIEPFSYYLAYIDVMTATSSWLRAGFGTSRNFCSYLCNTKKPIVKGSNVWNICCNIPVYNDVQIGGYVSESVEPILESKEPILEDEENVSSKSEESIPEESISLDDKEPILEDAENVSSKSEESILEDKESILVEDKEKDSQSKEIRKDAFKDAFKEDVKEAFNNMIITGPNGSGKSTYIKSIIECIILGQTIGVVPAKQFELTPFKNITTYLNIPDCQGKESLFQAEMNRCHQQLEMLENAETNGEFSFNIMDEIFVSTNYQEGMSGAYAVINQLCKFKNCLNIITTHFDVLANMNELKVDKQYFDIDIVIEDGNKDSDKDGAEKFIKDYKIKSGVSKKHMALKLLKNKGFSADIIKDAEYLYEKIRNAK